jgi:hypothetical protein
MAKNTNAKNEFLNHIKSIGVDILCATIQKGDDFSDDEEVVQRTFNLTTGYTNEDWNEFLSKLDFMYDSGWGSQLIFGIIWFKDGTWSDRGEYDGSEWYEHHRCPDIPTELKRIDKEREQKLNKIINEK